ncbi:MAG: YggT family protein [Gammaproteobacteria bacterium]|nr:MAG: YggT family protein [Gammaproteobacteria bacterium]
MSSPFQFLIETLFDLYIMVILLRFLLQLFRADFYNPLSQFVVRATNPVLKPLRKVVPGYGGIDVSSLLFAYVVSLVKYLLLFAVLASAIPPFSKLLLISLADLLNQGISLIFWMILIRALMSWVSPGLNNPIVSVIYQLTEPLMAPVRRMLPPMGGLDLSPVFLLLGLQFTLMAIESWVLSPLFRLL